MENLVQVLDKPVITVQATDIIPASEVSLLPVEVNELFVNLGKNVEIIPDVAKLIAITLSSGDQQALDEIDKLTANVSANNSFSKFTTQVKVDEVDVVGELVGESINMMDSMNNTALMNPSKQNGITGVIRGWFIKPVKEFQTKRESVQKFLDSITTTLESGKNQLLDDNKILEQMRTDTFKTVNVYNSIILAGIQELRNLHMVTLVELKKQVDETPNDLVASTKYQQAINYADKLEKKLTRIYSARAIAIRQIPQIEMMQNANSTEAETIHDMIASAIPVWNQQVALIISQLRTKRQVEGRQKVTGMINTTIQRNAELMHQNAVDIAIGSNSDFISVDTIRTLNTSLMNTFIDTKRINEEGRIARRQGVAQIRSMNEEFTAFMANEKLA